MNLRLNVEVTQQTYSNYKVLMGILRLVGVFPVRAHSEGPKVLLKISPVYLVFWWLTGGFLIGMTYYGLVLDSKDKGASIMEEADTDKLMFLMQATEYASVFVVGAVVNPFRFRLLFQYIKSINKLDSIMRTTYSQSDKYKLLLLLLSITLYNIIYTYLYLAGCFEFFSATLSTGEIFKRCTTWNLVCYLAWVSQFTTLVALYSLRTRITRFNTLLRLQYDDFLLGGGVKRLGITRSLTLASHNLNQSGSIDALTRVYLQIMHSANLLNDFVGVSFLITTGAVFWSMIYSLYFLMLNVSNQRGVEGRFTELFQTAIQLFGHTWRALMIINPAYSCLIEVEKTKTLVCRLLACKVNRQYRKQLHSLAIVVGLRELEFSACGFLVVNRVLFASLVDMLTTILMVLYQYRSSVEIDF